LSVAGFGGKFTINWEQDVVTNAEKLQTIYTFLCYKKKMLV